MLVSVFVLQMFVFVALAAILAEEEFAVICEEAVLFLVRVREVVDCNESGVPLVKESFDNLGAYVVVFKLSGVILAGGTMTAVAAFFEWCNFALMEGNRLVIVSENLPARVRYEPIFCGEAQFERSRLSDTPAERGLAFKRTSLLMSSS